MAKKNTYQSYGSVSKFFHWAIFILILGMIIYGFVLGDFPKAWKALGYNIHKLIGLTVLILMVLRMIWAFMNPKPKLPSKTPLWQIAAERLMHFSFYLVLLAMPIVGWIMAVAANKPPKLFGYSLTLPIAPNEVLAKQMGLTHEILAYVIIAMVVLHVGAALKHHYINKDNILKRMMPGKN